MCAPFGTGEQFKQKLYDMICDTVLDFDEAPRSEEEFNKLAAQAKESLKGTGFRVLSVFEESLRIFTDNTSLLSAAQKKLPSDIAEELTNINNNFFKDITNGNINLEIFLHYPRYIKVLAVMIEKAVCEPFKYRQKRAEVNQYLSIYRDLHKKNAAAENRSRHQRLLNELAQMIREYEINLFAQHIKTLYPISEKRLDKKCDEIKNVCK